MNKLVHSRFTQAIPVLLFVLALQAAQAQTNNWTAGNSSTSWTDALNWSAGLPTNTSNTAINLNAGNLPVLSAGAGNTGNLTVGNTVASGANTALTIQNAAVLTTNGFGKIGNVSGATGNVIVTDSGSRWSVSGNLLIGDAGNGTLAVANGGNVTFATQASLGNIATGSGNLTVDGANSILSSNAPLFAGNLGNGSLHVTNGGNVSVAGVLIGRNNGATGNVAVDGTGSVIQTTASMTVGSAGNGTLAITNGGRVNYSGGTFNVGFTTTGQGNLSISGTNSTLFSSTNTLVVGFNGTGTLSISGGGNATAPNIFLGANAFGHGNTTVSGSGSLLQTNGTLAVGLASNGTLTLANGGDALSAIGSVGSGTGSVGNATITGVGSSWTNSGNFTMGGNGTGLLSLGNGGLLSTSNFTITSNGTLSFGLAGTTGGLDYGEIDISGNATFGGTLTTFFTSGFNPVGGESFQLFAFGPGALISGNFSTYNLPVLDPGLSWDTTALLTSGSLGVVPEPAAWGVVAGVMTMSLVIAQRRKRN